MGLSKKNKKHQSKIRELTENVTDEEIEEFVCEIPSEEEMDKSYFPNPCFNLKSLEWLSQNMLIGLGEWGEAWGVVVKDENIDDDNFSLFPEEKKIEYRNRMVNIARRSRRVVLYKKWQYALEKMRKEQNEREWAWDDDWSTSITGGGAVVGGNGNGEDEEGEGEGEEVQMEDEAQEELAATNEDTDLEDDDPYPAEGLLIKPIAKSDFDFPVFSDGDHILYYEKPFSLGSWLKKHESTGSRWLQFYSDWSEKYKLETVEDWTGDRLGRECLAIIQSIVNGVLDYHSLHGPHGQLSDMRNFKLSQYVDNFGGIKKIRFKTELLNPDHSLQSDSMGDNSTVFQLLTKDMYELTLFLQKFLDGRELDFDMHYLLSLLSMYPFHENEGWKKHLLRNFPGLWDGQERAAFIVDFYYNLVCDDAKSKLLSKALKIAKRKSNLAVYHWIATIPAGSVFHQILIHSDHEAIETEQPNEPRPQYKEGISSEVVRYMRAVLHHHKQKQGGKAMDIRSVELCLSQLFRGFLLGIYMGMCTHKIYLN